MAPKMKIAVTGAGGLLGSGLVRVFGSHHETVGLTRAQADIRDEARLASVIADLRPQVVIHCAGIASPDVCETQPELAMAINVEGTRHVLRAAQRAGAGIGLISTDAVFDGNQRVPYTEIDPLHPISVYGRTKVLAEQVALAVPGNYVFRVSVLFGRDKPDFVSKGLQAAIRGEPYFVARDQVGSATYIDDAASAILYVIERGASGVYHVANSGTCTREELARAAAQLAGVDESRIIGKTLHEMKRPGPRVPYSVLGAEALGRIGFAVQRSWRDALGEYIPLVAPALRKGFN